MARTIRRLLAGLLLLLAAGLPAQTSTPPPGPVHVTLGTSVVALYGPWKFQVGDSPIDPATGSPLWAEPSFDDSQWETVDLTPQGGAVDPISGLSGYVPGWTAKGHPGYWGYGWYRIRVQLETRAGEKLALAGPANVDDAYQAFDNGKLVGSFGDFSKSKPMTYYAQPMMFQLPPSSGQSAGAQVLAFRLWMEAATLTTSDEAGGIHSAPLLGEMEAISAQHQMRWTELIRAYAGYVLEIVIFSGLGLVALSLTFFDRSDRVYVWVGTLMLTIGATAYLSLTAIWTQWFDSNYSLIVRYTFTNALLVGWWVMVWRVWFRLRRPAWIPGLIAVLVGLLVVSNLVNQNLLFFDVTQPASHAFLLVSLGLRLALAAVMLLTAVQGIREQGLEGWVVLPAMLLAGVAEFYEELRFMHIIKFWFPFGVQITPRELANLLLAAVLALLLLRRLVLSIQRQRRMALDVKQAQEVQQVMLPGQLVVLPGLHIESEYRPALEVGGDFFQIIPHTTDGSLLIVAGDVAGKGLKAGMLVALLVGAIRSSAESDTNPAFILEALNRRLLGRGDARATCLALRIAADGKVTVANAGHLPPYLNGAPLEIEGSLPLGLVEQLDPSLYRFRMAENDCLLVLSDGVAEATDTEGRLFGFDRVLELVRTRPTAADIANQAQSFGQEDDISVISLTRVAVTEPALK